jgi:hypothetical protein
MIIRWILGLVFAVFLFGRAAYAFSIPQMFWPQKDVASSHINDSTRYKKVLIASRNSAFKDSIIARLKSELAADSVYVKVIGLSKLSSETTSGYAAVLILNTCMGWDFDRSTHHYLKKQQNHKNIIVVTTSGSGDWQPSKKHRDYDAVSCASAPAGVEGMYGDLLIRIRQLLEKQ